MDAMKIVRCRVKKRTRWCFLFGVGPIGRVSIGCLDGLCQWLAVKCKKRFKAQFLHTFTHSISLTNNNSSRKKWFLYQMLVVYSSQIYFAFFCSCLGFSRRFYFMVTFSFSCQLFNFQSSVFGLVHGIVCCALHCVFLCCCSNVV